MLHSLRCLLAYAAIATTSSMSLYCQQKPVMLPSDQIKMDISSSAAFESEVLMLSSNALAFQAYDLLRSGNENLVFSPLSLIVALGMVYAGAEGSTQSQMARVLRLPLRSDVLSSAFANLTQALSKNARKSNNDLVLNLSNALWIQRGSTLLPVFTTSIINNFGGSVKQVDFASKTIDARFGINDWIKERTQGKITELFAAGDIPTNTSILVVSTIYMRGKWLTPFSDSLTRQTPFFPTALKSMTVPMMTVTSTFPFLKENDFLLVELPYDSRKSVEIDLSMFLLLPRDIGGLAKLETQIDASTLKNWIAKMQRRKVVVTLPRFKVMNTLGFEGILRLMGLIAPFSDSADFSKIDGVQDLKLSKIVQKGFISVYEKGTEAAVSSGVSIVSKGILDTESPELFFADHPFMFFIIDKVSGAIVFMGKVSSP